MFVKEGDNLCLKRGWRQSDCWNGWGGFYKYVQIGEECQCKSFVPGVRCTLQTYETSFTRLSNVVFFFFKKDTAPDSPSAQDTSVGRPDKHPVKVGTFFMKLGIWVTIKWISLKYLHVCGICSVTINLCSLTNSFDLFLFFLTWLQRCCSNISMNCNHDSHSWWF